MIRRLNSYHGLLIVLILSVFFVSNQANAKANCSVNCPDGSECTVGGFNTVVCDCGESGGGPASCNGDNGIVASQAAGSSTIVKILNTSNVHYSSSKTNSKKLK